MCGGLKPWLTAKCPSSHSPTPPLHWDGRENTMAKLMDPDEDREIAYQLLSWAK